MSNKKDAAVLKLHELGYEWIDGKWNSHPQAQNVGMKQGVTPGRHDPLSGLAVSLPGVEDASVPAPPIFVFGSNLAGRHGKGAALHARQHHGAVYGVGQGRTGNAYAIPTKDRQLHSLPLNAIREYALAFLAYAYAHPELRFQVTRVGCGLAGYTDTQIAPMFAGAPDNCELPDGWRAIAAKFPPSEQKD